LTFYWPEQIRQVRVRGVVRRDPDAVRVADYQARSESARALTPLADWVSYAVRPQSVEFWQGALDRRHQRLRYRRADGRWLRETPPS
jgi:pyridoxamine 5'-phosphate oxidase